MAANIPSRVPKYVIRDISSPCYYCKYCTDNAEKNGEICAFRSYIFNKEIPINAVKDEICEDIEFDETWEEIIEEHGLAFQAFSLGPHQWSLLVGRETY